MGDAFVTKRTSFYVHLFPSFVLHPPSLLFLPLLPIASTPFIWYPGKCPAYRNLLCGSSHILAVTASWRKQSVESESCCRDTGSHVSSTQAVDRLRATANRPSRHLLSSLPMISLNLIRCFRKWNSIFGESKRHLGIYQWLKFYFKDIRLFLCTWDLGTILMFLKQNTSHFFSK